MGDYPMARFDVFICGMDRVVGDNGEHIGGGATELRGLERSPGNCGGGHASMPAQNLF